MLYSTVVPADALPAGGASSTDLDQRITLFSTSWERYEALRELLDDVPGLRMTYLEGTLEIMSPSQTHEHIKTLVARLVELYAYEKDVPLYGYGSTTFRKKAKERGLEPDECYAVGRDMKDIPDIAFEVVLTSGGIDKLAVYQGLGVPEVWYWCEGRIVVHQLSEAGYAVAERSRFLPDLDLAALSSLSNASDQVAAVRMWREFLRSRG